MFQCAIRTIEEIETRKAEEKKMCANTNKTTKKKKKKANEGGEWEPAKAQYIRVHCRKTMHVKTF